MDDHHLQYAHFDRHIPEYNDQRLGFVADQLRPRTEKPLRILDIGCGDGSAMAYVRDLLEGRVEVHGLEPSEEYARLAEANGLQVSVGSVLDDQTACQLAGRYDAVVLTSVLHHLVSTSWRRTRRNQQKGLEHARQMLKPGGTIFVFEPCFTPLPLSWALFQLKLLGIRAFGDRRFEVGPINVASPLTGFFSHQRLMDLAQDSGLLLHSHTLVDQSAVMPGVSRSGVGFAFQPR